MPASDWRNRVALFCGFVFACSSGRDDTGTSAAGGANGGAMQLASGGAAAGETTQSNSGSHAAGGAPDGGARSNAGGIAGANANSGGRRNEQGGAGDVAGATNDNGDSGAGGAAPSTPDGDRTVFFLDVSGHVMTFDESKPMLRTLVSSAGQGPDGIAVDVPGGHIYWTTMGVPADDDGSVMRADLDGSHVTTIVAKGGSYTPKQLRLDAAGQKLYWSDREGMRIQRASLDGSQIETLLTVATGDAARKDASNWCVGFALDLANGYFYWTQKGPDDGMVGSIRRAHLTMPAGETAANRSDVEVLFAGLPEPVDLDVDVDGGYMYWTDRGDDTVNRAPIAIPNGRTASTRNDRQVLVPGVREAIGVTLDLARGHVYFTGGTGGRVGRANLDGSGAINFFTGSAAYTGISVAQLR